MTKSVIRKGLLIDPVILLSSFGYISRNSNNVLKKLQKLMILLSLSLTLIGVNIELSILVENKNIQLKMLLVKYFSEQWR